MNISTKTGFSTYFLSKIPCLVKELIRVVDCQQLGRVRLHGIVLYCTVLHCTVTLSELEFLNNLWGLGTE